MNNKDLIDEYIYGVTSGENDRKTLHIRFATQELLGTLCETTVLYSYDTPIAFRDNFGENGSIRIFITDKKFSKAISRHQNQLKKQVEYYGSIEIKIKSGEEFKSYIDFYDLSAIIF